MKTNQEQKKDEHSTKKSSAYYQRQYRERLRSQGLIKKEVWILPEHKKLLARIEEKLRSTEQALALSHSLSNNNSDTNDIREHDTHNSYNQTVEYDAWTTATLFNALLRHNATDNRKLHVIFDWIEEGSINNSLNSTETLDDDIQQQFKPVTQNGIIHVTMRDFGDLPLFMTVQGEQIIVETILCIADEITDVDAFNKIVLKTHKYFPLSTISLDTLVMENGETCDAYQMFGALHATSSVNDIMLEIYMLTHNVIQALEAYTDCFKQ